MNSVTMSAPLRAREGEHFWLAAVISLLLHAAVYYGLPYLQVGPPPQRIEMTISTIMLPQEDAPVPPAPEPEPVPQPVPKVTPPKPVAKPRPEKQMPVAAPPVLTAEIPDAPDDYVVQAAPRDEVPAPAAPEPVSEAVAEPVPQVSATPAAPAAHAAPAAAPASTSIQSDEISTAEAWDGYGKLLYQLVGRNKNYPQIAVRRSWQGEVRIFARFRQGELVEASVVTSSGHQVLDDEALAMVRKAAKELPVSGKLAGKSFTVTIPVAFKLFG